MLKRVFLATLILIAAASASAQTRAPPTDRTAIRLSFAPVVKKAAPAVVNIFSRRVVRSAGSPATLFDDPFFRRFFGDQAPFGMPRERVENSLGSGVIVNTNGLIVTNYHVIEDAQEVRVVLADRRDFEARILLSDQRADLAVLKIDAQGEKLPALEIGDSDQLEVGDLVLAIGNPFGVGQTVTSGIVSGLARTAIGVGDFRSFIQTDAAINPGNSGGALVDLDGRLIGVNTAIFSQSGGSIGIGFAIPTNMVRIVLQAAASGGRVMRPWLGATTQGVTADIAVSLGLSHPQGVVVKGVVPDSPAEQAGIRIGDVILEVDGHEVDDPEGLRFRVATLTVNKPARLALWRNRERREVIATVVTPPDKPSRQITPLKGRHPLSGATVGNLNPAFAEERGLDATQRGVVITDLADGSVAQQLGLETGDILVSINNRPIPSVDALRQLINTTRSPWLITIRRGDKLLSVTVRS